MKRVKMWGHNQIFASKIWIVSPYFTVILAGVFLFASFGSTTALPPAYAPMQAAYHYGDADGDTAITVSDLNIVLNYVNAQPYTFHTLQPDNPDADWNTCDVDSDQALTVSDKNILLNYVNAQPVIISDKPWVISAPDLRSTYNTTGVFFPFSANLASISGASGRPGISVIANIIPGTTTGSLSGRECDVIDNTIPDQAALPGAQCALAVTVTDWITDPTLGLTESGTYGLQVEGDAPGILYIDLSIQDSGLDVPAISTTVLVQFGAPNTAPFFTSIAGMTAGEGLAYNYAITADDNDAPSQTLTVTKNGSDTCGGSLSGACSGIKPLSGCLYSFTPDAGSQTCTAGLSVADSGSPPMFTDQNTSVTINIRPLWSTLPSDISLSSQFPFSPSYNYDQVNGVVTAPENGQSVGCLSNGTSCVGFTPIVYYTPNPTSSKSCHIYFISSAAETCTLRVVGIDNGIPSLTVGKTITIQLIPPPPVPPMFITTPVQTAGEGVAYNYDMQVVIGSGPDPLTVTKTASDTCGGTLSGTCSGANPIDSCTYSFTPGAGAQSCTLGLKATDGGGLYTNQTVTITINRWPTWQTAPTNIAITGGLVYNQTNGTAQDVDTGQTLTCSNNVTSCGFAITVTGSGASPRNCNISFTAPFLPTLCNLRVTATDNGSPAMSVGTTIFITTSSPTTPGWIISPSNIIITPGSCYNQINGQLGGGTPGDPLTCSSNGTSCSGFTPVITGSGFAPGPVSCNISFCTTAVPQICNLRVTGTDTGSPAHSVGSTITITVRSRPPTFSTPPANINITSGSVYNQINGVLTDPDTGETLTCSTNSTSCFGFAPTYTGSGTKPVNCTLAFTAGTPQTCNVRLVGTDNGTPAASVGTTITITVTGTWTWMSGSNAVNQYGVYGTKGAPDPANVPGARYYAASWTDLSGNFWLFGGYGYASVSSGGLNDLWRLDGANWTWISGSNVTYQSGVYGTKGVPDPANVPGYRYSAVSWKDASGNLWLFGGLGFDGSGNYGDLNDLWIWDGSNWTWMSGSSARNQYGIYGTEGVPDPVNVPGGRGGAVSWTDASGNFWLFGGFGYAESGSSGYLNDLWRWDGTNWTWISGNNAVNQLGVYGTKGVPSEANRPGGRSGAVTWTDDAGNLWLFGGYGYAASGGYAWLNDLWRWDGANWTWISGSNFGNQIGVYGTKGVPDPANGPGARTDAVSWTDATGNRWLFGGRGYATNGGLYYDCLNDLWRWDGANWTWISGSNIVNQPGVYGTKGVPALSNVPGARYGAVSWTDAIGNLWLFGGSGYAASGGLGNLNDLWRYK